MHDYIAFVNTDRDCQILRKTFPDSAVVRATGESCEKTLRHIDSYNVWIDPGVDCLEQWTFLSGAYRNYVSSWATPERIVDPEFQKKPDKRTTSQFVRSVLDKIGEKVIPQWISVPQLPYVAGSGRNKINRQLAASSGAWKLENRYPARLIVPVIITHVSQIKLKQERNKKVELAAACLEESGANALWIVDSSLNDQDGAKSVKDYRLRAVIEFHEEIRDRLGADVTVVAGPYWGLNLILWCRGLANHPAIGLGNAFQYHLPGGVVQSGKSRIAISPLKRTAVASNQLNIWLNTTLGIIARTDPAYSEIASLARGFAHLSLQGRQQVADAYSQWLDKLQKLPATGRSLGLYQDFSSAYVFGRGLPTLPNDEGSARRPERVAEQLMLYCL